ncbi:MAG: ATP-dependent helicase [Paenibacillaceae bacterium]
MKDLTSGLNPEQARAVLSESDRILMLAGAGSGKTKTLTHRLAHLNLNCRVGVSSIIAITFTRAAAKEMKDRLIPLIGKDAKKLICCTFHALAVQILQQWGHRLGLDKQFTIYSREDREEVIKSIIKKGEYRTTYKWMDDAGWIFSKNTQELSVWNEYQWQLKRFNAVDLDYLIPKVVELFTKHSDVADYYRRIWKYVFTDETQDTDLEQYEVIKLLNPVNLFAIGDPKQSIYGFRGARVGNILEFTTTFPNTEFIELFRNYRSTKQIVESANNLISHSDLEMGQSMATDREGNPVVVTSYVDSEAEAQSILDTILAKNDDKPYSDFAVLARTNAQIDYVHSVLRKTNIPCVILSGSDDPLKRHDIKYLIAYLDCIFNEKDETNFKRVLNFPEPVVTETQLQLLEQVSVDESITLREALGYSKDERVLKFHSRFNDLVGNIHFTETAVDALKELIHYLKLEKHYEERSLVNRVNDLNEAIQYVTYWCERQEKLGESYSAQDFLKWVRIRDITEKLMDNKDAVKLMTIHGSKGLEFDTVFLIGMNQGVFPHRKTVDIEEERRLAYVGETRAKRQLFLSTTSEAITKWGKKEILLPSQFIRESRHKRVSITEVN